MDSIFSEFGNTILLYSLGLIGWVLGERLKLPAAPVLGVAIFIGAMRVMGINLPYLNQHVIAGLQIMLGVMIGGRFDKNTFSSLKTIALPAAIISAWAVTITLLFGYIISLISPLDITTGILGSSIGGLPEMTILAHDTDADSVTVVLFHILRLLSTMLIIPFILKWFGNNGKIYKPSNLMERDQNQEQAHKDTQVEEKINPKRLVMTLLAAGLFGGLFLSLGVPAGGLVGGLLFVMIASYFETPVQVPPMRLLNWFLVGIGLMVSNQISPETVRLIFSGELGLALLFSLVFTLGSSLIVAFIIYKITRWEFMLCFLASAPAGFTVMTGFALQEGYDPVKVSLLHLSRLVTLKLAIPILFMIFY